MDFDQYQLAAQRTMNHAMTANEALVSYSLGVSGEVGEISELFAEGQTSYQDIISGAGDICWYVSAVASTLVVPLSRIATLDEQNIHRYRSLGGKDLAVGLCIASARLCERVKKQVYHEKTCDIVGALGEVMARVLVLTEDRGATFREVAEFNLSKLKRRYPLKFEVGGGVR